MPKALKGFNDLLPADAPAFLDSRLWAHLLAVADRVLGSYAYAPVYLPIAEDTGLFARGLGESTDVVSKEMYSFEDRGGRPMTLRPEGTAGAVRAFVEHAHRLAPGPHKWWYAGPMFRAERPQKGRYRQFYQVGAEYLGVDSPLADVEMLQMLHLLCQAWGLPPYLVQINTLGDAPSREAYRAALSTYFAAHQAALCESCQGRLAQNVLRILDCKRPACGSLVEQAPDILDALSEQAAARFAQTQALLTQLEIPSVRNPRLVRGLDYYTGLIFEFVEAAEAGAGLGSQNTLLGGGRYDGLVQELGGPPTPAVGFSAGLERIALLLAQQETQGSLSRVDLLLLPLDSPSQQAALELAAALRRLGPWKVDVDLRAANGKLKQQLRRADRLGHRFALVLGESERQAGEGKFKDLQQRSEQAVRLEAAAIAALLGS
jgi:histidyl-tRNA synthetase